MKKLNVDNVDLAIVAILLLGIIISLVLWGVGQSAQAIGTFGTTCVVGIGSLAGSGRKPAPPEGEPLTVEKTEE